MQKGETMVPIQEIDIYTNNDIKFSAHIIVPHDSPVGAEVITYDPAINKFYSSYQSVGKFKTSLEAFEEILLVCNKYASTNNGIINRLNNPCNTEFISKEQQDDILSSQNLSITADVNK